MAKRCPDCDGYGEHGGSHCSTCHTCNGEGEITEAAFAAFIEREREHARRIRLINRVRSHIYRLTDAQLEFILDMKEAL